MVIIKCGTCKKEKPESEYNIYHGKRGKSCKQCREYYNNLWKENKGDYKEKRKKYYRENKERHKARSFKNYILKQYGLTVETYNKMLKEQSNQCGICEIPFNIEDNTFFHTSGGPCIDHCHQTNKVRGLLCRKCNLSLYYVEFGFIEKAKKYLRVHEVKDKEPS